MKDVISRDLAKREKRAKAIAAMGLVNRVGDHFTVSSPGLRGSKDSLVRRDEAGSVVCDCGEFAAAALVGEPIRCEHIMAVKFSLVAKNTEPALKNIPVEQADRNEEEKELLTESRRSERGEQEDGIVPEKAVARRQAAVKSAGQDRLKVTNGDKEMKRDNSKEIPVEAAEAEETEVRDNVLNFSTTLKELRKHVDPALVKQREGWRDRNGNVQMVDYVEWHTVADILDETAPDWAHTVKDIRQIGDHMTVTVAITIGGITREGIGTGLAQSEMGIKKAEHDALKRAAVKFGIARDLYKKESDVIEREGSGTSSDDDGFPTDPVAKNLGDLVTAKQLGMIRAIAREIGIDPDEESNSVMHCSTDELSKRAASSLIGHLQTLQRANGNGAATPLRKVS